MKIISDEEKNEHFNVVLKEGAKGLGIGAALSFTLVQGMKKKYPMRFSSFNPSMKAAMWAMPTIGMSAFFADQGSWRFDEEKHQGEHLKLIDEEKKKELEKLSTTDRLLHTANENKYKIVVVSWAASLYGSWHFINKDKYMTTAQKAVQARVVAQAITVVLLLGTILLSVHENELKKREGPEVPEWKKILEESEQKNDKKI